MQKQNELDTTSSGLNFPNQLASRKEKCSEAYGLSYIRWAWYQTYKSTTIFNNAQTTWKNNRKAAEGLQSILDVTQRMGYGNTSSLNIDIKPINYISKIVDISVSNLMQLHFAVNCTPLNPESKLPEKEAYNKLMANLYLRKIEKETGLVKKTGIPIVPHGTKLPEEGEDIDVFYELQGKQGVSLAIGVAIEFVLRNNNFEEKVLKKIIRDLVVCKWSAVMRYYDEDYKIKIKWIDICKCGFPYSSADDFENMTYVFYREGMTIEELGKTAKKADGSPRYTEKELLEIAQKFQGDSYNNPKWNATWTTGSYEGYYNNAPLIRPYYNFNIPVIRFWFRSISEELMVKTTKGKKSYIDSKQEIAHKDNKEILGTKVKEWRYSGCWIAESDYIFNYREDDDLERDKEDDGYSPYTYLPIHIIAPNIFDMQNKSMVEKGIPSENQINLIHQKIQAVLLKFKPETVSINEAVLTDLTIGKGDDETQHTADSAQRFEETGTFVYHAVDANGNPANIDPLRVLPSDAANRLQALYTAMKEEIKILYDTMGYNDAMNAQLPTGEVSVGAQQLAKEATLASLEPLYSAELELVGCLMNGVVPMIQDSIKYREEDFINSIGEEATKIIELMRMIPMATLGIEIEAAPDQSEIQFVYNLLQVDVQNQVITSSDAGEVMQVLYKNQRLALRILQGKENLRRKQKADAALIPIQENAKAQQESNSQAAEQQKQVVSIQLNADMKRLQEEYRLKGILQKQTDDSGLNKQVLANTGAENVERIKVGKEELVANITKDGKVTVAKIQSTTDITKTVIKHHSDVIQNEQDKENQKEILAATPKPEKKAA